MHFVVGRSSTKTGAMLEKLVRAEMERTGVADRECVICYGASYQGQAPSLNASITGDKMEQGIRLERALGLAGLKVTPVANLLTELRYAPPKLPVVARKRHHAKGKDIRVCRTVAGLNAMLRRGRHDFVTPLTESDTEYRVWVYRKRVLCSYEKRLTEPEKNVKFGRNRDNGWTFHQMDAAQISDSARVAAVAAVKALDLDFGAVDMLAKKNGDKIDVVVLEVNSAPGVSDEHRSGIVKLAHRIVRWVANGCPRRDA